LLTDDRLFMMPKVDADVLEDVVRKVVKEFQEELRKLALLAYPDLNNTSRDNIIRPIFIRGLQPGLKDVLEFREFSSFTEAVKTAKFVESQIF